MAVLGISLWIFTFVTFDLGLSFVLFIHGSEVNLIIKEMSHYNVTTDFIDLWFASFLRASLLLGALIGFLWNKIQGRKRLRKSSLVVRLVMGILFLFGIVKLLMYSEMRKDLRQPWFWGMICWSEIACIVTTINWSILANVKLHQDARNILVVNEMSSEYEREPLLDEESSTNEDDESSTSEDEDEEVASSSSKKAILQLLSFSKPDFPLITVAFCALLVASISDIFLPFFTGQVIDGIVVEQDLSKFTQAIVIMTTISLVSSVATGCRGGLFTLTMARLNLRIRNALFRAVLKQEIGFFDKTRTGDITSRLTSDTTTMSDTLNLNTNVFLRSVVKIVGFISMMIRLSWQLTVITLVTFPIIALVAEYYGKFYEKLSKEVQDSLAQANNVAEETVSTVQTVRSFANEDGEATQYSLKLNVTYKLWKKEALIFGLFMAGEMVLETAMVILTLYYGGHLVIIKTLSGGQLISFLLYQLELGDAIEDISNVYTGLMQASGASVKVFEMINRKPEIKNDGEIASENFKGVIEFKNVSFAYPSRPDSKVLKDISFRASPGEVVALVGPSGGGKSSCVGLLEHFYEPDKGQVLVDGIPVREYDHKFIHSKIALVGQEPVLYARSIKDNIGYGLKESNFVQIQKAAQLANAHNFIEELDKGYDTETGEKGTQISGGQKQRIAIARALVRNPKVLILDEATSALDAESEHLVQKALFEQSQDRTIIIIAHRLSTIENADRIVVIDKGQVIESGNHSSLIRQSGLYSQLVQRQLLCTDEEDNGKKVQGTSNSDSLTSFGAKESNLDRPSSSTVIDGVFRSKSQSPAGLLSGRSPGKSP